MSLLFYVGKRRGYETFAGAKVRNIFDICKKKEIFLRKNVEWYSTKYEEERSSRSLKKRTAGAMR